jgi:hypothetical protein
LPAVISCLSLSCLGAIVSCSCDIALSFTEFAHFSDVAKLRVVPGGRNAGVGLSGGVGGGGGGISAPEGLEKLVEWVCSEIRPGGLILALSVSSLRACCPISLACLCCPERVFKGSHVLLREEKMFLSLTSSLLRSRACLRQASAGICCVGACAESFLRKYWAAPQRQPHPYNHTAVSPTLVVWLLGDHYCQRKLLAARVKFSANICGRRWQPRRRPKRRSLVAEMPGPRLPSNRLSVNKACCAKTHHANRATLARAGAAVHVRARLRMPGRGYQGRGYEEDFGGFVWGGRRRGDVFWPSCRAL